MEHIIYINEENNNLEISGNYEPIMCGNSNYFLNFSFDEEWNECNLKTAIFFVNGKRIAVDFEGNTVQVPILPNTKFIKVALISAKNSEEQLTTSTIKIETKPTEALDEIPELDPISGYVQTVIGAINSLQNGEVVAKTSEVAENVSNPNLLINGDFKVNQRGGASYSTTGAYTVDRWKLVSGSLVVEDKGITLNGTITQTLENPPTMDVVASVDTSNGDVTATYSNGFFTISTTAETLITWAKLEVGTTATTFSPRPYAEELAMCQRYYQKIKNMSPTYYYGVLGYGWNQTTTTSRIMIDFIVPMRVAPTLDYSGKFAIHGYQSGSVNITDITIDQWATSNVQLIVTVESGLTAGLASTFRTNNDNTAYIALDAEIY